jgi:two-component system chemotaxis sensor kinase CheA
LRRVALDAAVRLGKEVELTLAGEAVKLDRRILNDLRDPLVHLVRNAVDHGIERPEARRAAGKRSAGTLSVRVEPRGNRVGIVVEDDGAGLDVERVKQAAVRKGATTAAAAAAMNDREAARLVFLPGLTTATEVTAISGRGVGLDVVHDAVLRLRGKIEVGFARGRGTRFELDLPLTIATTVGLLVRIQRDLAVLPSESVERVLSVRPGDVGTVAGASTVVVDGSQIPFADLGQLLGVRAGGASAARPAVVLAAGTERVALALDELVGQEEVVVSALGSRVARVAHLAGAALLDDGRVVAVLDPAELVRRARPAAAASARTAARARILVTDDSFTTRTAVKSLLEVAGYEVLAAEDGQAALELLRQTRCDVVVSDVQMPRLDGLGLVRAVKADPRLAGTPVVLVTSLGSSEDRAAGLAAGADGYLVKKDVQGGKLLELVRQLLPAGA